MKEKDNFQNRKKYFKAKTPTKNSYPKHRQFEQLNSKNKTKIPMTEWLHFHFPLSCIGEGNGNPLQCSCLENPRDGGAWWAALYGVAKSWTRLKQLSSSSSSITLTVGFDMENLWKAHLPQATLTWWGQPPNLCLLWILWGLGFRAFYFGGTQAVLQNMTATCSCLNL